MQLVLIEVRIWLPFLSFLFHVRERDCSLQASARGVSTGESRVNEFTTYKGERGFCEINGHELGLEGN